MINKIIEDKRDFFETNTTKNILFRIEMLKNLKKNIIKYEKYILEALRIDLRRSDFVSYMAEIKPVLEEIDYFIKNIKNLSKLEKRKTSKLYLGYKSYVLKEPFGVCLIISPWNYPFLLSISPLIGAIAGGNCVILKPSEHSKHTSYMLKILIEKTFAKSFCEVVLGKKEEVQNIIDNRVDFIFFTGGVEVGKDIMKRASKNLTPVALELGGKSPCIVDKNVDIKKTAKRIVWGKFLNTGQTCIAPDYLIVHKDIANKFIKNLEKYITQFWGKEPLKNKNYPKIINKNALNSCLDLLNDADIIYGGKYSKTSLEPTLVFSPDIKSNIMKKEIFGPILPIFVYETKKDIYDMVNKNKNPLSLYVFSRSKNFVEEIINNISSGCICINDVILQVASHNLPFEGIGNSGMNGYHGEYSFKLFTHKRGVLKGHFKFDIKARYPHKENLKLIKNISKIVK